VIAIMSEARQGRPPAAPSWAALALAGTLLLAGGGCERATDASLAKPYEACDYASVGEPCGVGPTVCKTGLTDVANGYCTQSCKTAADCFKLPDHERAVCEQLYDKRQCALRCTGDADCPEGNVCADLERFNGESVHLCQPK
jgi:hypothetical protein